MTYRRGIGHFHHLNVYFSKIQYLNYLKQQLTHNTYDVLLYIVNTLRENITLYKRRQSASLLGFTRPIIWQLYYLENALLAESNINDMSFIAAIQQKVTETLTLINTEINYLRSLPANPKYFSSDIRDLKYIEVAGDGFLSFQLGSPITKINRNALTDRLLAIELRLEEKSAIHRLLLTKEGWQLQIDLKRLLSAFGLQPDKKQYSLCRNEVWH